MNGYQIEGHRTNLEWDLDSPHIKVLRNPSRRSSWIWGDQNKLQQAISYFFTHSSIHGIQFIGPADRKISRLKRFLYTLVFLICVMMMLGSVTLLLQNSVSRESVYITVTDKDADNGVIEDPYFPVHPKIYICRRPSYRTDVNMSFRELIEFAYLSLGFPYVSLTPDESSLFITGLLYKFKNITPTPEMQEFEKNIANVSSRFKEMEERIEDFSLTDFLIENSVKCEDVFITCYFHVFPIDCCKVFKPIITNLGMCFSYELSADRLALLMQTKELEFFLHFDMHAVPRAAKALDAGYETFVLDPRYLDGTFTQPGYYTLNGHQLTMRANLVKTSRIALYTPWHGFYSICPRLEPEHDPMGYGDRYFLASCIRNYVNSLARQKCKCRDITDYSDRTLKECSIEKQACINSIMLQDNLTSLSDACNHPCLEYNYEITTNLIKIGNNNISRLVFTYERNQYSLEEYKRTTFSSSLSQIGGSIGLYIGASIISALELLMFLISYIWYKFLPHKRTSNNKPETKRKMKKRKVYDY